MKRLRSRTWLSLAVALAAAVVAAVAAVTGQGSSTSLYGGPDSPAVAAKAAGTPSGLWAKPPIGKSWAEYFGVQLEKKFSLGGPRLVDPKPGQLYFYTNSGTAWGATNTKNSVVVFDATDMRHWKHVATTDLPDEYSVGYSSHGATVSPDGRWIYLQSMANPEKPPRLLVLDGFTLKPYKVFKETQGGFGGHHINNFTGPDGREYVMNVDFNWNFGGAGAYVIDPQRDQAIVGGVNRQDLSGNPYVMSGDVQGKYMYATVPSALASLRGKVDGTLDKIDLTTWKVVGAAPVKDPIWVEPTQDGKIAWVTEGDASKVAKVDLDKIQVIDEVTTGPGPWGARLSYDESKLYVADKGEAAGYGQQGRTITVIDTKYDTVIDVLPTGRTTDHLILSPDGKYIVASSNADHTLSIFDTATDERVQVVKVPNDGDVHAGTFVQWKSDGKGGVVGEVVSTLTGLRGSARAAQLDAIKAAQNAITVRVIPRNSFAKLPTSFNPDTITVKPGATVGINFIYAAGTSGPRLSIEGQDAGIARFDLLPGKRQLVTFKAPSAPGTLLVTVPGDPKAKPLTIAVGDVPANAPAAPGAQVREVKLTANGLKWDLKTLTVKAGEQIRFTIVNQDDEKHNLLGPEAGLVKADAPDIGGGRTGSFTWTVPNKPGTYKFFCEYHPWMVINTTIEK